MAVLIPDNKLDHLDQVNSFSEALKWSSFSSGRVLSQIKVVGFNFMKLCK